MKPCDLYILLSIRFVICTWPFRLSIGNIGWPHECGCHQSAVIAKRCSTCPAKITWDKPSSFSKCFGKVCRKCFGCQKFLCSKCPVRRHKPKCNSSFGGNSSGKEVLEILYAFLKHFLMSRTFCGGSACKSQPRITRGASNTVEEIRKIDANRELRRKQAEEVRRSRQEEAAYLGAYLGNHLAKADELLMSFQIFKFSCFFQHFHFFDERWCNVVRFLRFLTAVRQRRWGSVEVTSLILTSTVWSTIFVAVMQSAVLNGFQGKSKSLVMGLKMEDGINWSLE